MKLHACKPSLLTTLLSVLEVTRCEKVCVEVRRCDKALVQASQVHDAHLDGVQAAVSFTQPRQRILEHVLDHRLLRLGVETQASEGAGLLLRRCIPLVMRLVPQALGYHSRVLFCLPASACM